MINQFCKSSTNIYHLFNRQSLFVTAVILSGNTIAACLALDERSQRLHCIADIKHS